MKEKSNGMHSSNQAFKVFTQQLGVWCLHVSESNGFALGSHWKVFSSGIPLFGVLVTEVYRLDPMLFIIYFSSKLWSGLESALLTYLSGQVLREIETGLRDGQSFMGPVINTISYRLICLVLAAFIGWQRRKMFFVMKSKMLAHFEFLLMRENLRIDLATSKDPTSKSSTTAREAWQAFSGILDFFTEILGFVSQMALIINLSRSSGGPLFSILCVAKPIISVIGSKTLWDKSCLAYVNNPHFTRLNAMQHLSAEKYRQDVISSNLSEHILNEYSKSLKHLGNVITEHPFNIYGLSTAPWFDIFCQVLGDLPMVYCAIKSVRNPSTFSLSTIAILQQSSTSIRNSLQSIFMNEQIFRQNMHTIQNIYAAPETRNKILDGALSYPQHKTSKLGMSFDLRNVSFEYPGSTKSSKALESLSLEIKPGELVVIVGANGSGKSTLIRVLSRLYDPTSGAVYIDGELASSYKVADLHRATAILSQDNNIFPVSLGENIGLGYAEHVDDKDMVVEAAKQGGAYEFISKLNDGMDTILDPLFKPFVHNIHHIEDHPLHQVRDSLQKKMEISGGETQRVVAARTFMRFNSGFVNFVAVDEPSSALDAQGELHLFEELIKMRKGKTMIFVTHRFGHLTQHADKIICMKDGVIVEAGTHRELMEVKGEYANLYGIQARAFIGELNENKEPRRE